MAKIKQGILGGFSGKVANVVGTSWKGRAVMKSQPLSVANPRTESQVGQRNKFSKIAELASKILTQFVQPVENPIAGNISGYNLFCKDNKQVFNAAGEFIGNRLVCGGGKIANLDDVSASGTEADEEFILTWDNAADVSPIRLTDKVFAVVLDESGNPIAVSSGVTTRATETLTIGLMEGAVMPSAGDNVGVLYACVSADGRDVSVKTYTIGAEVA